MRRLWLSAVGALVATALPLNAAAQKVEQSVAPRNADDRGNWITLGTRAGPIGIPSRSQPANLLTFNGNRFLVDAGDGTIGQLARAGVRPAELDGIFISHLHFDHTGGLAAILGLRFQTSAAGPIKIYGPPGTQEMVAGLVASMLPGATAGYGVPGAPFDDPRDDVEVVELRDGSQVDVDGVPVQVRNNTHYSFAAGSPNEGKFESLSYRFNLPGRSIVYTGDTGPSSAVEELARDADLLIAEMMDVDMVIASVRELNKGMPDDRVRAMETHLRQHHLLPRDVGEMAARARVKGLVITHFAGAEPNSPRHFEYLRMIAAHFVGPVVISRDMDVF